MANGTPPGPGVDARGVPVVDPSANVIALNDAAIKRQDDLRTMEARHVRELMNSRFGYAKELSRAESARIDAIHQADVSAGDRAAILNAAQQTALAAQVEATAATMRTTVEQQRISTAEGLVTALTPIQASVAELTRALWSGEGGVAQKRESRGINMGWTMAALAGFMAFMALMTFVVAAATGHFH